MAANEPGGETGKALKLNVFWVLCFLHLALTIPSRVSSHGLKNLNKPYGKSIKSPDGDIIDCVLIHLQPAFDNSLLKNHTIQMKPSFNPEKFSDKLSSYEKPLSQLWHTNGKCPDGTIPIRRISNEYLQKARSFQGFRRKAFPRPISPPSDQTNAEYHEYVVQGVEDGEFYGGKAGINVWNPRVQEGSGEFSLAQIWLCAGKDEDEELNTIEAGWQVYPDNYGDNRTSIFTYWTRDSYLRTGCYNLQCSGFVQTDKSLALGGAISPISTYKGNQNHLSFFMFKDPKSGNWWLQIGKKSIGYWPGALFTHLKNSATMVEWGGEVVNTAVGGKHTTTEMGSGRFPVEGTKKAANFINLKVMDETNALVSPEDLGMLVSKAGCYDISTGKNDEWGDFFFFGGNGRNPNCQ